MSPPADDFEVRLGRIRDQRSAHVKPFVNQVLAAAQKAGGVGRGRTLKKGTFGRGRAASLTAGRALGSRSRIVVVKARVVRHGPARAPLATHLDYLRRDGVDQDGRRGILFDAERDESDGAAFTGRCEDDRHHFRFIVAPEYAAELSDLKAFTRDLMNQAERDLGTKLDWVATAHWNTAHPHIHVLVRGRTDDGQDLVISRDYISEGLRARAGELVTLELGPRTDLEIRRGLEAQVEAEHWTRLDSRLAREAAEADGLVDLRPARDGRSYDLRSAKISRLRKLERLGLAQPTGPARWRLSTQAEPTLRALARRNDVIARLHRAFADESAPDPSQFSLQPEAGAPPIVGRLAARGLDDELTGSAYAVIDGLDGRKHHVSLPDLAAASDALIGAVVETYALRDGRTLIRVRSDLDVARQATAPGATWLDRRLLSREAEPLPADGFGGQVRTALDERVDHLVGRGLARREGRHVVFVQALLDRLRREELDGVARRLVSETNLEHRPVTEGDHVGGAYRRRLDLASGRFAMLDDGLGFQLVPWRPELERFRDKQVGGVALPGGGVDWSFGRKRGLSR